VLRLVLASASPRRAELLRAAGFTFDTIVTRVNEDVRPGESPAAYVERLAHEKSGAALSTLASSGSSRGFERDFVVLGADTAVVVDGDILGKPRDDEDAGRMLERLSGRRHDVLTGISARTTDGERTAVEATAVYFRDMTDAEISWYVASGEGRDKAGGYAVQGLASRFVPRIEGSYSNVVGLPIATVCELLRKLASNR